MSMTPQQIAQVCHEANRSFCQQHDDYSQMPWSAAADWQRESAIKGVEFAIENPTAPASAQHDAWSKDKLADGWMYGETKNADAKTHTCLVPFHELPEFQQRKDILFKAIVAACIGDVFSNPLPEPEPVKPLVPVANSFGEGSDSKSDADELDPNKDGIVANGSQTGDEGKPDDSKPADQKPAGSKPGDEKHEKKDPPAKPAPAKPAAAKPAPNKPA